MPDQPTIDVRVWQKVSVTKNPVFCNLSWSIGIQVTDIPKYFEMQNILMFVLLLGGAFEAVEKRAAVLRFTGCPCCWMLKTSQFP